MTSIAKLIPFSRALGLMLFAFAVSAAAQWSYPPAFADARSEIYKSVGDTKLSLYIFEPTAPGTNRPAIVFFFGGGWASGSPAQFESQCRYFAARGMVAITADYRVRSRQNATAADCVADAKSCIRWLRRNAPRLGIDPQRIVAGGGSAGGHIAAATATLPGLDEAGEDTTVSAVPNALVLFNPALVLAPFGGLEMKGFGANFSADRLGAEPQALSPLHHVRAGLPPTFIAHGKADTTVPFTTVDTFAATMKQVGNRCDLVGYEGQQHGFFNNRQKENRYYGETLAAAEAFLVSLGFIAPQAGQAAAAKARPSVVFILCDDLGYGDVQCLNPQFGKIKTPNLDRLATQGMTFTDAHSGSSVCSPTRYGILTGRYSWRTRLQSGVLGGFSPPLIAPGRLTVAELLRQNGYSTAAIGKWHLGMTWPRPDNAKFDDEISGNDKDAKAMRSVDWTKPITDGPLTHGFDSYFGISASLDMPPFVFIRNDRVTQIPTVEKKWVRKGPAGADFEAVDVLPSLTAEAVSVINAKAAKAKAGQPFFLYLALNSPHTPVVPAKDWSGKSGLGDYADFVMQTDASIGQVLAALDSQGLSSNTLLIATSDNGFSPAGDPQEALRKQGHRPSGQFRGYKADIWDGGHRIPFFARWPGVVKAGAVSDQVICLVDFMATCADLLGAKLPANAGEDSVSFLPEMLGTAGQTLRETVVHHSINGSFAIRQGNWKLELCPGSGGWSEPKPGTEAEKQLPAVQLYNLGADIGETNNLQAGQSEVVSQLKGLMEKYIADGRSTPGPTQTNDVAVKLQRPAKKKK